MLPSKEYPRDYFKYQKLEFLGQTFRSRIIANIFVKWVSEVSQADLFIGGS
jgi:hypothetical protein